MKRVDESSAVPFALSAAVSARLSGLTHIELAQMRGSKSYQLVPGQRYSLEKDGRQPEHDEAPDDSAAEIAGVLWEAARAHHSRNGGDLRFRVRFFNVTKTGDMKTHEAKFSVGDGDDDDASESADTIDAHTRRDILTGLVSDMRDYIKQLHDNQEKHDAQRRGHAQETADFTKAMGELAKDVFTTMGETMRQAFTLRLDAFEDRLESTLEGAGAPARETESPPWMKDAVDSVKELFNGPIGQAGIAKLMGIDPKEAAELMSSAAGSSSSTSSKKSGASDLDLRPHLRQLGMSLSEEQKATLKDRLGAGFGAGLMKAGLASSPGEAISLTAGLLSELEETQVNALDEVLNPKQVELVSKMFDILDRVAEQMDADEKS